MKNWKNISLNILEQLDVKTQKRLQLFIENLLKQQREEMINKLQEAKKTENMEHDLQCKCDFVRNEIIEELKNNLKEG